MNRLSTLILVLLVGGGAFLAWQRLSPTAEREEALRPAPSIPHPDAAAKAAYFFEMTDGKERVSLHGEQVAAWQAIGRMAVYDLGAPALDYLLAGERLPAYRARPNRLYNLLSLLPRLPGAAQHPRLYPFLLHWLDRRNCPPSVPGADWATDIRQAVFAVFVQVPAAPAVPPCVAELRTPKPKRDLRGAAIKVLLALARTDELRDVYALLPPTEAEPDVDLRGPVIEALYNMAAPVAGDERHAQARVMLDILRAEAEGPRPLVRIQAMGALLRLGDAAMEERLWEEFRAASAEGDEARVWAALDVLSADEPRPAVRAECLKRLAAADGSPGYIAAVRMLLRGWAHEDEVRALIWEEVDAGRVSPLLALPTLATHDRARVVAFLKKEIASGEAARLQAAVRIAIGKGLAELGPTLLDLVRAARDEDRPFLYASLVQLGARRVSALLVAELDPNRPAFLRGTAATELLNLGEHVDVLRAALERGDEAVLAALQQRAQGMGRAGVPPGLLPGVLDALRKLPGEEGRLTALFVLRCRGTLDGVREDLVEAYRREPSRRVAKEIGKVVDELAHR